MFRFQLVIELFCPLPAVPFQNPIHLAPIRLTRLRKRLSPQPAFEVRYYPSRTRTELLPEADRSHGYYEFFVSSVLSFFCPLYMWKLRQTDCLPDAHMFFCTLMVSQSPGNFITRSGSLYLLLFTFLVIKYPTPPSRHNPARISSSRSHGI